MSCKVVECISSEVGVCRTSTKGRLTKQDLCGLLVISLNEINTRLSDRLTI